MLLGERAVVRNDPRLPKPRLMRQYHGIKQQVPNALLLFRLGDFYELFFDDAVTAARELEITLTARNKEKGQPIPMCGVPYHASENYIARLIQKGYRVAICDQMEEAGAGKKLVRREVTRIVTPGTAMNAGVLRSHENNYLAAVFADTARAGVAHVDVSTGEFRATEIDIAEIPAALETLNTKEALAPTGSPLKLPCLKTDVEPWVFGLDYAARSLCDHFHLLSLDGCGLENRPLATGAAAAPAPLPARNPARRARPSRTPGLLQSRRRVGPRRHHRPQSRTRRAPLRRRIEGIDAAPRARPHAHRHGRPPSPPPPACSFASMPTKSTNDSTRSPNCMPKPILRARSPTTSQRSWTWSAFSRNLALATAGPSDLAALAQVAGRGSVAQEAPGAAREIADLPHLDEIADVRDPVLAALADEPPVNLADLGVIRDGYDPRLDELRDISENSKTYLAQIEARERTRTDIASLKVRFNNVFGYYIEISKANLHLAPPNYERKQTLVNAERFTTPELKELEVKILEAEEKMLADRARNLRDSSRAHRLARRANQSHAAAGSPSSM